LRTDRSCHVPYSVTRTWIPTFPTRRSSDLSQTINVSDNTAPVITVPADATVECDEVPAVGTATATDNCDTDVTVTYIGETRTDGACTDTYSLTRTWRASSEERRVGKESQTGRVRDNDATESTATADASVDCGEARAR